MRTLPLIFLLAACAAPATSSVPEGFEMPAPAPATDHHVWLHQFAGDWNVSADVSMDPTAKPVVIEFSASTRVIGELWILSEGSANFDGQHFTSLMTLGFDPTVKAFVGSWVDSMQTYLWKYRGTLDAAGRVLTLVAEGPAMDNPAVMAEYRDVIEVMSKDEYVITSSVRGSDGKWTTFTKATYRRR